MNGREKTEAALAEEKKLEAAAIGKEITVRHADGKEEVVTLREIPISMLSKTALDLADEEALAARFARKERNWVRGLSIESYELLVTEGEKVNGHFFRFIQRRSARMEKLRPGLVAEAIEKATTIQARTEE